MIEFSRETALEHSPAEVWAVLSAFEDHKRWNPYCDVERESGKTGTFNYRWRVNTKSSRYLQVGSKLLAEEPERLLAFEVKPNFLMTFEERYTLDRIPGGTRLVHSYLCRGPLITLRLPGIRKSFETMLSSVELRLGQYLKQMRKPAPIRPRVPSKGFRSEKGGKKK